MRRQPGCVARAARWLMRSFLGRSGERLFWNFCRCQRRLAANGALEKVPHPPALYLSLPRHVGGQCGSFGGIPTHPPPLSGAKPQGGRERLASGAPHERPRCLGKAEARFSRRSFWPQGALPRHVALSERARWRLQLRASNGACAAANGRWRPMWPLREVFPPTRP